ncbi:hypothetical protein Q8A67_012126 [Cirrhinus molitorella]|uniref:Uncharacterized protein n=1 Tax=Cirrhinus molitorella TaxID=172907 RepID=A0AA88PPH6_9TELE|nr:hypothetical protein Q8A67_012126 [Cirrhinus molitorella]
MLTEAEADQEQALTMPQPLCDSKPSQDTTNTNAVLRAKAKGFLNIAKDGVVLRFCCFLHDTIYQLSNLSKSLQRSVSTLAEAQSCLSSTQAVIEKYKSRPGPKLRSVLDTDTYEGVLLKPSDAGQRPPEPLVTRVNEKTGSDDV